MSEQKKQIDLDRKVVHNFLKTHGLKPSCPGNGSSHYVLAYRTSKKLGGRLILTLYSSCVSDTDSIQQGIQTMTLQTPVELHLV